MESRSVWWDCSSLNRDEALSNPESTLQSTEGGEGKGGEGREDETHVTYAPSLPYSPHTCPPNLLGSPEMTSSLEATYSRADKKWEQSH